MSAFREESQGAYTVQLRQGVELRISLVREPDGTPSRILLALEAWPRAGELWPLRVCGGLAIPPGAVADVVEALEAVGRQL